MDNYAPRGREGGDGMRIDLLEKWLKEYPYGYCNGINFQTCRANQNDSCPYCTSNVHCSDGHAALEYYREMLRYMRMKPRKARKVAIAFAESLPSIMQSLDVEIEKIIAARIIKAAGEEVANLKFGEKEEHHEAD